MLRPVSQLETIRLALPSTLKNWSEAHITQVNDMLEWIGGTLLYPQTLSPIALEILTLQFLGPTPTVDVLPLYRWWCLDIAFQFQDRTPRLKTVTLEFRDYHEAIQFHEIEDAVSIALPNICSRGLIRLVDGGPAIFNFR